MNALWNKKNLERPANNIWIANRDAIDLNSFSSVLEIAVSDLESQNTLHTEAAILSRLIYRMKSKFRGDKGLKNMEKVNRALLNYLEIKLSKDYKDLRNYIEVDGSLVNLPTKQMLQYILVRTQGFAKLMSRVESVAKQSAQFFRVRISIGHAWTVSVIAYSVVSRVWFLARYLLKRCCLWYNGLRERLDDFKIVGPVWLSQDYRLPEDLKTWLDLPWIDEASDSVPLRDDGKETIFGLIKGREDETCAVNSEEEEIEGERKEAEERPKPIVDDFYNASLKTEEEISPPAKHGLSILIDDVGMSINREDYLIETRRENSEIDIKIDEKLIEEEKEESKTNLDEPSKKRRVKKSRASKSDDIASPIPLKKRKKNSDETSRMIARKSEDQGSLESSEPSSAGVRIAGKVRKKGKLTTLKPRKNCINNDKDSNINEIKTRNDLAIFLSKNSHPSLDKLQWNMLMNSIKKFVVKLEKCQGSSGDEKKEIVVLKKINREINNWIQ